jgi:hypothetical protein
MARNLTSDFENQINGQSLSPAIFVSFNFQDGNINLWSGYHDIVFNGAIYVGAGNILAIDKIEETQEVRASSVSFSLNGLNSALISSALQSNYQGRSATMWFAVLDNSQNIISSPYELFTGRMDIISFADNGETADFVLKCESNLIDIRKARERRYTPEDQKTQFEGDKGLDFMPKIQDIDIVWG